jgi:hypothetical protein
MYPHVSMPVIFRDRKQDQPQAAVITCVHSDVCVNVVVFMDRDRWPNERRTSIAFFPTEADAQNAIERGANFGACCYPPLIPGVLAEFASSEPGNPGNGSGG